jgi:hypothetical protein
MGTMNNKLRDYELNARLTRGSKTDPEEWIEDTLVEAKNMAEAYKMAKTFGRIMAIENNAKLEDAYAIDLETYEYSD